MVIALYGSASDSIADAYLEGVYRLGRKLAENGHSLIFGGGSTGLMGAAADGVLSGGGHVTGVMPSFLRGIEPVHAKVSDFLFTESTAERKAKIEQSADAFIIVPGGIGTFDEFFQILAQKVVHETEKPIILFNFNHYWDEAMAMIRAAVDKGFAKPEVLQSFYETDDPEEVLSFLAK